MHFHLGNRTIYFQRHVFGVICTMARNPINGSALHFHSKIWHFWQVDSFYYGRDADPETVLVRFPTDMDVLGKVLRAQSFEESMAIIREANSKES